MGHVTVLSMTLLYNAFIYDFVDFVSFVVQLNLIGEKWNSVKTTSYAECCPVHTWEGCVNKVIVSL